MVFGSKFYLKVPDMNHNIIPKFFQTCVVFGTGSKLCAIFF